MPPASAWAWRSNRLATAKARSPRAGDGPVANVDRKASTPRSANHPRQCRTASGVTPNASATSRLVQPCKVSRIARTRSASPRTSERDSARNPASCSALALPLGAHNQRGPTRHGNHPAYVNNGPMLPAVRGAGEACLGAIVLVAPPSQRQSVICLS